MICRSCRLAGDFTERGAYHFADKFHVECRGDCPCQHHTDGQWISGIRKAPTPKREG